MTMTALVKKFCFGFDYAMSWAFLGVTGGLWWISQSATCEAPVGVMAEAVCCAHCEGWRLGTVDRQVHLVLAFLGVFINVVPKYIKKDESPRHLGAIGIQRWWNPLIVHIIGGIFTVLPGGMAGVFGWHSPAFMKFIVASSLLHDISIYGLLKNHDGIWAIRAANLFLATQKTIIALAPISAESKADLLFFMAFGFMGTRVLCTVWYILTALSLPSSLVDEYWYSGGLAMAQFYIFVRCWQICGPIVFLSFVVAAMVCYHKRWNRRYQAVFIISQAAMLGAALYVPGLAGNPRAQITLLFVFFAATFKLPFWRRQRMSNAVKLAKAAKNARKERKVAASPALTVPLGEATSSDDVKGSEFEHQAKEKAAVAPASKLERQLSLLTEKTLSELSAQSSSDPSETLPALSHHTSGNEVVGTAGHSLELPHLAPSKCSNTSTRTSMSLSSNTSSDVSMKDRLRVPALGQCDSGIGGTSIKRSNESMPRPGLRRSLALDDRSSSKRPSGEDCNATSAAGWSPVYEEEGDETERKTDSALETIVSSGSMSSLGSMRLLRADSLRLLLAM